MRDPIREKDIEQALGLSAGEVTVDVADDGIATIRIKRDHLDRLLSEDDHADCYPLDMHYDEVSAAAREGDEAGYGRAVEAIRRLSGATA